MAAELLAHVAVQADVVEEVIALEDAVLVHHPVVGLGDVGLQDRGARARRGSAGIRMSPMSCIRAQTTYSSSRPSRWARVAVCSECSSRSTAKPPWSLSEQLQVRQQPVGQLAPVRGGGAADGGPVLLACPRSWRGTSRGPAASRRRPWEPPLIFGAMVRPRAKRVNAARSRRLGGRLLDEALPGAHVFHEGLAQALGAQVAGGDRDLRPA